MLGFLFGNQSIPTYEPGYSQTPTRDLFPDAQMVELTRKVESLELACAGLWHLLKHHHGYSDDQLVLAIQAVDDMDGVRDGKITPSPADCPSCGRRLLTRSRQRCAWCGVELVGKPFSGA